MRKVFFLSALIFAIALLSGCKQTVPKENVTSSAGQEFKGVIKLDVRESTPDWKPYVRK